MFDHCGIIHIPVAAEVELVGLERAVVELLVAVDIVAVEFAVVEIAGPVVGVVGIAAVELVAELPLAVPLLLLAQSDRLHPFEIRGHLPDFPDRMGLQVSLVPLNVAECIALVGHNHEHRGVLH